LRLIDFKKSNFKYYNLNELSFIYNKACKIEIEKRFNFRGCLQISYDSKTRCVDDNVFDNVQRYSNAMLDKS